jgi:hypothetical protein
LSGQAGDRPVDLTMGTEAADSDGDGLGGGGGTASGDGEGLMGVWSSFLSLTSEAITSMTQPQPPDGSPQRALLAKNLALKEQENGAGAPDFKPEGVGNVGDNRWLIGSSEAEIRAELEARARRAIDEIQARARDSSEGTETKRIEEKRRQANDTMSKERRARDLLVAEIKSQVDRVRDSVADVEGRADRARDCEETPEEKVADDAEVNSASPCKSPRCAAVSDDIQPVPYGGAHSVLGGHMTGAFPRVEMASPLSSVLHQTDGDGYGFKEDEAGPADDEAQAQAQAQAQAKDDAAGCISSEGGDGHSAMQHNQARDHGLESHLHGVESQLRVVDAGDVKHWPEKILIQGSDAGGHVEEKGDHENGRERGGDCGGQHSTGIASDREQSSTEEDKGNGGSSQAFGSPMEVCAYDGAEQDAAEGKDRATPSSCQDAAEGKDRATPSSCPLRICKEGCDAAGEGRSTFQGLVLGDTPGKSFGREAAAKWLEFESLAGSAHCVVNQCQTEGQQGDECSASHQDELNSDEDLSHFYYTGDEPGSTVHDASDCLMGSALDQKAASMHPPSGGLGLLIRRNPSGAIVVAAVARGSAADGHLVEGDRILSIDGCSVAGMRSGEVLNLLSGSHPDIKVSVARSSTSFLHYSSSKLVVSISRGGDTDVPRRTNMELQDWVALLCGKLRPLLNATDLLSSSPPAHVLLLPPLPSLSPSTPSHPPTLPPIQGFSLTDTLTPSLATPPLSDMSIGTRIFAFFGPVLTPHNWSHLDRRHDAMPRESVEGRRPRT